MKLTGIWSLLSILRTSPTWIFIHLSSSRLREQKPQTNIVNLLHYDNIYCNFSVLIKEEEIQLSIPVKPSIIYCTMTARYPVNSIRRTININQIFCVIFNNNYYYSLKCTWIVVDICSAAKPQSKYPPLSRTPRWIVIIIIVLVYTT